jgi:glycerol-3-phosphate O-acyltransferase/dihydroxyacetone phosphate acyltransferase
MNENEEDPEFADFRSKVENYCDYCSALLIRDSQAATLDKLEAADAEGMLGLIFRRLVMLVTLFFILVPFFVVALPIGLISMLASDNHAKTALSASSVKVVAADVKGSYKIIVGFALVPLETILVSIGVYWVTGDARTALTVFFSLPMAMYVSLLILQEAVLELRAALPLVMSLLSKHKQFKKLYDRRQKLVAMAERLVNRFDPALGEELKAFVADTVSTRQPSLFSLRHGNRRTADRKFH